MKFMVLCLAMWLLVGQSSAKSYHECAQCMKEGCLRDQQSEPIMAGEFILCGEMLCLEPCEGINPSIDCLSCLDKNCRGLEKESVLGCFEETCMDPCKPKEK